MEITDDVLEVVTALRSARKNAIELAARGDLDVVFGLPVDSPSGFVYLVKLLDVHPALGKVKGRRLMADMGLGQFVRVSGLSEQDKRGILDVCEAGA